MKDLTKTTVTIANPTDKEQGFVPYAQSFIYKLAPSNAIKFPANSVSSIYYSKQASDSLAAQAIGENDVQVEALNSDGTPATTFFVVNGILIGECKDTFKLKIYSPSITSKDQLPSGVILKIQHYAGQTDLELTKDAFEANGSLIYDSSLAQGFLRNKAEINFGDGFETYTIDSSNLKVASQPEGELLPFALNQYVAGVKIAVTKDTTELDQFLESYVLPQPPEYPISPLFSTKDSYCSAAVTKTFTGSEVMFEAPVLSLGVSSNGSHTQGYLYSTSEQRSLTSPHYLVHKGWSAVDLSTDPVEDEYYGDLVTTDVEVSLTATDKVASYNSKCDPINGVYFGAIEGEAPSTYTIDTEVKNGTSSGESTISVGGTTTIVITAGEGYDLPNTISVTGADYNWDIKTGEIILSNPQGDVSIYVECIQSGTTYGISYILSNCEVNGPSTINSNETVTLTIVPYPLCKLPDTISVTNVTYTWEQGTDTITILVPSGEVTIEVTCPIPFSAFENDQAVTAGDHLTFNADASTSDLIDALKRVEDSFVAEYDWNNNLPTYVAIATNSDLTDKDNVLVYFYKDNNFAYHICYEDKVAGTTAEWVSSDGGWSNLESNQRAFATDVDSLWVNTSDAQYWNGIIVGYEKAQVPQEIFSTFSIGDNVTEILFAELDSNSIDLLCPAYDQIDALVCDITGLGTGISIVSLGTHRNSGTKIGIYFYDGANYHIMWDASTQDWAQDWVWQPNPQDLSMEVAWSNNNRALRASNLEIIVTGTNGYGNGRLFGPERLYE